MFIKETQALLRRRFNIPKEDEVLELVRRFTLAERGIFFSFVAIFVISGLFLLWRTSSAYLVQVPIRGGSFTEGVIGNPRFINPVLALSEADKNLTTLVYSGLIRVTSSGNIENDLAEEVTISDNQLIYTVKISREARFHDGHLVTADDILFTISKITDPLIKSPRRGNWDGVLVEKVDDRTVKFTLKKAYAPFIYNLTTGILPRHIWKNVTDDEFSFSQFNTLPIGSGPYEVESVERNSGGIPDYYKLSSFNAVMGKDPFIDDIIFKFYPSETTLVNAYKKGDVESMAGVSPEIMKEFGLDKTKILHAPLPRVFAVFFNQSQSKTLLEKSVRRALDIASPKKEIVRDVLGSYGTPIKNPLPASIYPWAIEDSLLTREERLEKAREILSQGGWEANEETGILEKKSGNATLSLSFSISTSDAMELKTVAGILAETWRALGAEVEVLTFETGELNQSVIRPRQFEALLFGEVVGRDADLYPFWHSSQRNDPGLNIALYANTKADKLLERGRGASDPREAEESYLAFSQEVENDMPAVFLYSPNFIYVVPEKLKGINLTSLSVAQDRFLGVRDWYIDEDKVWKIFIN